MWAQSNLGATTPEGVGLFYSYGEVEGHEQDSNTFVLKDGHVFSEQTSTYYSDRELTKEHDAVSYYYKDDVNSFLNFRMPTAE
jgi:hypothetical protein